jgi:hypothetical protein
VTFQEPIAEILSASQFGEIATVVLHATCSPSPPIVPAGLYERTDPSKEIFQLHKLIGQDGNRLTFETYAPSHRLPPAGMQLILRSWWLPEALEAVVDYEAEWTLKTYPDDGDHNHCLLTGATISAHSDHSQGYHSKYGWITLEAYQKYIQQDSLRLRQIDLSSFHPGSK